MKRYSLLGIAGLVARSNNRSTGLPMSLYAAEQAELDSEDPWMVVCETHGTMVSASTQAMAKESMAYPTWCEECDQGNHA
jgi:hypothetical protein